MRTLDVWDTHLARSGAELLAARLALVQALRPRVATAYRAVAVGGEGCAARRADLPLVARRVAAAAGRAADARPRRARRRAARPSSPRCRPRRSSGAYPSSARTATSWCSSCPVCRCKGYASHGESWSYALAPAPRVVRAAAGRRRRAGARARRRLRRARRGPARPPGRAGRRAPSRCSSPPAGARPTVPEALSGSRLGRRRRKVLRGPLSRRRAATGLFHVERRSSVGRTWCGRRWPRPARRRGRRGCSPGAPRRPRREGQRSGSGPGRAGPRPLRGDDHSARRRARVGGHDRRRQRARQLGPARRAGDRRALPSRPPSRTGSWCWSPSRPPGPPSCAS
jgi:hypothetical protein